MLKPISTDVKSITTGKPEKYWLDSRELPKMAGKKVAIVDDLYSRERPGTVMYATTPIGIDGQVAAEVERTVLIPT